MVYIFAKIVNVFCFCKLWDCYRGDSGYRLIVFAERFACLDFLERVAIPGEDSSYRGDSGYRRDSCYRLIVFAERFAYLDFLERVAIPGEDSSYRG